MRKSVIRREALHAFSFYRVVTVDEPFVIWLNIKPDEMDTEGGF